MLEQIDREETEKRPGRGKKSAADGAAASKKTNTIPLSAERLAKLWKIVTGGTLVIDTDEESGETVYLVGRDSFDAALPILLDRL